VVGRSMETVLSLLVAVCYVNVVFCSLALHKDIRQQKQVLLNFASLPQKLHANFMITKLYIISNIYKNIQYRVVVK